MGVLQGSQPLVESGEVLVAGAGRGRRLRRPFYLASRTALGRVGLCVLVPILFVVLFGPLVSPHSITEVVGGPFAGVSAAHPFGTDYLGRDVLSRFLHGARFLVVASLVAPLATYSVGGLLGILAGSVRGWLDTVVVWVVDVLLSVPALILALLILTSLGAGQLSSVAAVTIVLLPSCVRITRAATLDAASVEYVEAALARGESRVAIAVREILPNIRSVLAADFGLRVAYAALTYAGLSFLGLGLSPPAADWALMVSENLGGLLVQPVAVIAPAIAIALFTVSVMAVADSVARSLGRSA